MRITLRMQMLIRQTLPTTTAGMAMKQLIRLLNHLLALQRPLGGSLQGPFNAQRRYCGYPGRHQ
jgi:hypothetical protein